MDIQADTDVQPIYHLQTMQFVVSSQLSFHGKQALHRCIIDVETGDILLLEECVQQEWRPLTGESLTTAMQTLQQLNIPDNWDEYNLPLRTWSFVVRHEDLPEWAKHGLKHLS